MSYFSYSLRVFPSFWQVCSDKFNRLKSLLQSYIKSCTESPYEIGTIPSLRTCVLYFRIVNSIFLQSGRCQKTKQLAKTAVLRDELRYCILNISKWLSPTIKINDWFCHWFVAMNMFLLSSGTFWKESFWCGWVRVSGRNWKLYCEVTGRWLLHWTYKAHSPKTFRPLLLVNRHFGSISKSWKTVKNTESQTSA